MEDFELLERKRELQVLSALIAAGSRGAGQLAVVEGTAGIGKTCLLAAARAVAQRCGLRVLGARGSELEREFAYGVVRQLFEPALTSADPAGRAELLAGAAEQAAVLFGHVEADTAPSTSGDVSFATLYGLFWLTTNLCAREPLMLVIDDLHWSDVPSLRFLTYLLPRLEGLPLVVLVGLRPAEPAADPHLLTQITADPLATLVRPAPLSQAASTRLVRTVLTEDAEEEFCLACHTASGGNPLLLHELIGVALAEGLEATAAGMTRLAEIGPRAVRQRVALRLARLGPQAAALCAAVAILGDGADPRYVATLAGLQPEQALQTARQLVDIGILYHRVPSPDEAARLSGMLGFVHPLVRSAVYEGLSETERLTGHARAAHLLSEGGKAAEQVAAHLLHVPPATDSFVVATLRRAADEAFARGSPESAVSSLERCLQEPPPDTDRADILLQLGTAAQLFDMVKGANYLTAAMAAINDPVHKATITEMLGRVLYYIGSYDEAVRVYSQALRALGKLHTDLRRRLETGLINASLADPALQRIAVEYVSRLRDAPPDAGPGSRMLDTLIALYDTLSGPPAKAQDAVARVLRQLTDRVLVEWSHSSDALVFGCYVLMAADLDEVLPLFDAWLIWAHQRGSMLAVGQAKCFHGQAWIWRGHLTEAETKLREAVWAIDTTSASVGRPFAGAYLADALMEQGRLAEAEAALDWIGMSGPAPPSGHWFFVLDSRARLLMLQGRIKEGLETMLACGRRFVAHGGHNPAVIAWRSGAALALFTLDRPDEARALAAEELTLARHWGAPRALGRALRVAGLVQGGKESLALLRQAVEVLASSPARLEYAKALVELGAALRRSGQRLESRHYLRCGVELAQICGATPLIERGYTELRASDARPRRITPSGPDALTPSERRVAELAAAGHSNRHIAQILFITTNTVEAHLTRTYRKLGITGRTGLTLHLKKS